jgi:phasin
MLRRIINRIMNRHLGKDKDGMLPMQRTAFDVQETLRQAVEAGLDQTRTTYAQFKTGAEDVTLALDASFTAASKGVGELNAKAVEILRNETLSVFDLLQALMMTQSLSEVLALQTRHLRTHFETAAAEAQDFMRLAQKIATDTAAPFTTSAEREPG